MNQPQPQAQPQPQSQPQPQPQMANGGETNQGFEAQETMQGDGVAQPQQTTETPQQPTETPIMEEGGEVKQDGLDWGLVFTFFNFKDE